MTLTIITYYYVLHFYPFIILHSITPAFIIFITKSLLRSFTSLLHHHNCNHDITSLFHDCYIIITFTIITLLLHHYYLLLKIHYYILFHYYYTYFIINDSSLQRETHVLMIPLLRVMQREASIITFLLPIIRSLLHWVLLFYYYSSLPISVSRTCRWTSWLFNWAL